MKKFLICCVAIYLFVTLSGCGSNFDKAVTTEEALTLLKQYDLHASMNYMVHFVIADSVGNSVAVEYIDDEMIVTKTPVLTNFYLVEGEKTA